MQVSHFSIPGPVLITPKRHEDGRGFFMESFRADWFAQNVADVGFVQDNHAKSTAQGTIRGLHYQAAPLAQGKLIRCIHGAIFDVAVDIRPESPHFGHRISATLTPENAHQLWSPEGFAHGYCTLAPETEVEYKVTQAYSPEHDGGIAFDDPDLDIEWPIDGSLAVLSAKDRVQPRLSSLIKG